MPPHTDISAVLFRFPDEDPCCRDVAVLVTLGEGAAVLTERFADYAQFLPATNWMKMLGTLTAIPQTTEQLLHQASLVPCIIAISGALTDEDTLLAARLVQRGEHCTVVIDATTQIRPEWKSVIRLPPHHSRDAQWAWAMRVYLDAMLNRGLICLDSTNMLACTENRLSQFTVVHTKDKSRAMAGVEQAMQSLATRCDLGACNTFLLLFHSGPDIRLKEIHWGIQALKIAIKPLRGDDYLLMVGHLPDKDVDFAVSLMAGMPQH
ncbi:MAG: hypothetical protein B7Z03_07035 [Hydrogenophilales bacterium 32-62-9]|nr:MAG: hypothetical protein B7Z03_07035 [Hydrogenophilales bacterium 32-62-9]